MMVTDLATLFEKILLTFYLYKIVSLFIYIKVIHLDKQIKMNLTAARV